MFQLLKKQIPLILSLFLVCSNCAKSNTINENTNIDDKKEIKIEHIQLDGFLASKLPDAKKEIKILVAVYLPTKDNKNLDQTETGITSSLLEIKEKIKRMNIQAKFMLEQGSKFRGYKNSQAIPYLTYQIVDYIIVYDKLKRGREIPDGSKCYYPDYYSIVKNLDGKKYIEQQGVDEIWLWGWHHGDIAPAESKMSSPATGDISNSWRSDSDLPSYNKTYMLYNYNYGRSANQAVHNHGHQFESYLKHINHKQDGNFDLFLSKFSGWTKVGDEPYGKPPIGRVGDCHHPPNTTKDYDYVNYTLVQSDIENWKPEGGGETKQVNADTWGDIPYQWPNGIAPKAKIEAHWYIYWMQNFPGYQNNIPYGDNVLTNWWEFVADWENAIQNNTGLYK